MYQVRLFRREDEEAVLRINAESRPHVAALDAVELLRLVELGATGLVAVDEAGRVRGYLLAFDSRCEYDGEEFAHFRTILKNGFTYIDQVAVDAEFRSRGLGGSLYRQVAFVSSEDGVGVLCCEVNTNPPNPVSLSFHERQGFRVVSSLETADGRTVALLTRSV